MFGFRLPKQNPDEIDRLVADCYKDRLLGVFGKFYNRNKAKLDDITNVLAMMNLSAFISHVCLDSTGKSTDPESPEFSNKSSKEEAGKAYIEHLEKFFNGYYLEIMKEKEFRTLFKKGILPSGDKIPKEKLWELRKILKSTDPTTIRASLDGKDVYFIPPFEGHYYLALSSKYYTEITGKPLREELKPITYEQVFR